MKNEKIHWAMWLAIAIVVLILTAGPVMAQTTRWVNDDDPNGGVYVPPGTSCTDPGYSTIQTAVTSAAVGDTINVCVGTYTEQVTVATNNLTLQSVTLLAAMIKAPASMSSPEAIVRVNGATGVSIFDFTISGPGGSGCGSIRWGVRIDGSGSATLDGNRIQHIQDSPFSGCQNGVGVLVGRAFENETGTATITNNRIVGYQKGGIVVDNAGSSATITGNIVVGDGPTPVIAQNGIQVSRGAAANVSRNWISENWYTGCSNQDAAKTGCIPWVSAGLLLFDVQAASVKDSNNQLGNNQFNVLLLTSQSLDPGP